MILDQQEPQEIQDLKERQGSQVHLAQQVTVVTKEPLVPLDQVVPQDPQESEETEVQLVPQDPKAMLERRGHKVEFYLFLVFWQMCL